MTDYYIYDIETFPNIFTCVIENFQTGAEHVFEWSERRNDMVELMNFIEAIGKIQGSMVGFNNLCFDYPMIHAIWSNPRMSLPDFYNNWVRRYFEGGKDEQFAMRVWDNKVIARQVDLMAIHNFFRSGVSLKLLEFNMGMGNIQDLPIRPGEIVPVDMFDALIDYNKHDVKATRKFFEHSLPAIEFRDGMREKFGKDVVNFSNTKLGSEFFIKRLEEESPGICYRKNVRGKGRVRQTVHESIKIKNILFDYISFKTEFFNNVLDWYKTKEIKTTKSTISKTGIYNDVVYKFALGGIHASTKGKYYTANKDLAIVDVDVASYYPNLFIQNGLHPAHLGELFCVIYKSLYDERRKHAKGTDENLMLKEALNSVFGNSNNEFSPFRDASVAMTVTINGQLLLCMLAEWLTLEIPGLFIIQVNTDGVTFGCHPREVEKAKTVYKRWEDMTKLVLEEAFYNRMIIRDVNNYIAESTNGKVKYKGAYMFQPRWNQSHSGLVIAMAASEFLLKRVEPTQFLQEHDNMMDFMYIVKGGKKNTVLIGDDKIQNISRYYLSTTGGQLTNIFPPLPKKPDEVRPRRIHTGWNSYECNDIRKANPQTIDYTYYEQEVEKLIAFAR